MALYLFQASFTNNALTAMVKSPQDRPAVFSNLLNKLGGKLHEFYYAFGGSDVVVIFEMPNETDALTAIMAVGAAGHLTNLRTTQLFTSEDTMAAMSKAGSMIVPAPTNPA